MCKSSSIGLRFTPAPDEVCLTGFIPDRMRQVSRQMLMDPAYWQAMADIHRNKADAPDRHWRGEYWGKLLRGASILYSYTRDNELYQTLEDTVRYMLDNTDENGLNVSYTPDVAFSGWDLQCRKYTLLGLEHFYEICRSEELKARVLQVLIRNADDIVAHVGPRAEGKIEVTETYYAFGCTNSISVLQPMVRMYAMTGEERYLAFARYLVGTGLCAGGSVLEQAHNGVDPYRFHSNKYYELTSCFEGLAEYIYVTGEKEHLPACMNYYRAVRDTEMTVIGGLGTNGEFFNYAALEQSDPDNIGVMQENCGFTTWAKFCWQLFRITGEPEIMDTIETVLYNAMAGSYNPRGMRHETFDSYTRLVFATRRYGASGFSSVSEDYYCTCCSCNGVSGLSFYAVSAYDACDGGGLAVNLFAPGTVRFFDADNSPVTLQTRTRYPFDGAVAFTFSLENTGRFPFMVRIPSWCENGTAMLNGQEPLPFNGGAYLRIEREWRDGDCVTFDLPMRTRLIRASEKCSNPKARDFVALRRGPLVLARDQCLSGSSIVEPVHIRTVAPDMVDTELLSADEAAGLRLRIATDEGGSFEVMDFAHAGWTEEGSLYAVWLPTEAYWQLDRNEEILIQTVLRAEHDGGAPHGILTFGNRWRLLPAKTTDLFHLCDAKTAQCLTVGENGGFVMEPLCEEDPRQLWRLENLYLDHYMLVNPQSGLALNYFGSRFSLAPCGATPYQVLTLSNSR